MDYELVTLNEKTVVGLCARTSNRSPDMGAVIGGLWQTYYQGGIYPRFPARKTERPSEFIPITPARTKANIK